MRKFAALFLALALSMSMMAVGLATDYESKTFECWWDPAGATLTIDKVYVENGNIHVPVGAVVTYTAANDGVLCIGRGAMIDEDTWTIVHWTYDPAVNAMVKSPSTDKYFHVHTDCPQLTAGTTYTFTITEEIAESLSIFNNLSEKDQYGQDGAEINAGCFTDLGHEISTGYLIIDAPAGKPADKPEDPAEDGNPFTDVPAGSYYHDAVLWALENGITKGTSDTTFGPTKTCTRGQVVTFLWRAKGCPEPTTSVNPFTDVKESDYFYKAVLWAVENGITNGTSTTTFGPGNTCTSAHVVTFLWRANGKPAAETTGTEYYAEAVAWGNANELLTGTDTPFAPGNQSPRADIVTYLYRNFAK